MSNIRPVRFEVPLSPARYGELERLSERIGICPRDVARLAIAQLLENADGLLRKSGVERPAA